MRLKFELLRVTNVDPQTLSKRIHTVLMKRFYVITHSIEDSAITFKDDEWEFRPMSDIDKKVDSGKFEILILNGETNIKYTYFVSFIPELLILLGILVFAFIIINNNYVLLLIFPLLGQFLIRINSLRSASQRLINSILDL